MDIKKLDKYLDKKIIIPIVLIYFLIIVVIARSSFDLWSVNLKQDTTNNINYHAFSSDTNGNGVYEKKHRVVSRFISIVEMSLIIM